MSKLMKRMPVSQARKAFPDLVNQAFYAGETTIVTRRGKGDVAAIIPIRLLVEGLGTNSPKATHRKPSESSSGQNQRTPIKQLS
jgi:antitoxin (DNA-binding transcriptional repressor) of toxin-antitoxin stability system